MVNPDIFLIGAAKAGTTTISDWMAMNPKIALARIKESNYFSKEIDPNKFSKEFSSISPSIPIKYWEGDKLEFRHQGFIKDSQSYARIFEHSQEGQKLADCSTSYFWSKKAPDLIKKNSPNAKVLLILRNPVDRAWSHYRMARKYGLTQEGFLKELEKDFLSESVWGRSQNFYHLSCYSESLTRWMQNFDKSQLKIEIYESFFDHPQENWDRVCDFFGVEANSISELDKKHESQDPRSPKIQKIIFKMKLKTIRFFIPEKLYFYLKNLLFYKKPEVLNSEIRNEAMKYFTNDIDRLETLMGRSLSLWNQH